MLMGPVEQSTAEPASRAGAAPRLARFTGAAAFVGLAAAVLFVGFPGIDFAVTDPFFVGNQGFIFNFEGPGKDLRTVLRVVFWTTVVLSVAGLAIAAFSRRRLFGLGFQKWLYLTLCLALGPGLTANVVLKDSWGRARPFHVTSYGGQQTFTPALVRSDQCRDNCSFVSGEASALYSVFFALALLAWRRRRRLIWLGIGAGTLAGFVRIAQGGHFLSDVVFAGVFMALIVRLVHWLVFERTGQTLADDGPVHRALAGVGRRAQAAGTRTAAALRAVGRDRLAPAVDRRLGRARLPDSLRWLALERKAPLRSRAPRSDDERDRHDQLGPH